MSMKITYRCDICRDDKQLKDLLAVNFSNLTDFVLIDGIAMNQHQGIHICKKCCIQIQNSDKPYIDVSEI